MLDKEAQLSISIAISCMAYKFTKNIIPRFKDKFIKAHLVGIDQAKANKQAM